MKSAERKPSKTNVSNGVNKYQVVNISNHNDLNSNLSTNIENI